MQRILAVSGDPGGARTLQPVLNQLTKEDIPFIIVSHGLLVKEAPPEWPRVTPPNSISSDFGEWFKDTGCDVVIFTSSIEDKLPLCIARSAKQAGAPVMHLLDHWSHYSKRLETDGLPEFIPDIYTVMDELAYQEALSQGIPAEILEITGHPNLSNLMNEYDEYSRNMTITYLERLGLNTKKKLLLFISEPIEQYYGTSFVPNNKDYNEKKVLRRLCDGLQRFASEFQVGILPHPRENEQGLLMAWNQCRGMLEGQLIRLPKGRQALFFADGVLGMNSILMYEAWLLGIPVLSAQPFDSLNDVIGTLRKDGMHFLLHKDNVHETITNFLREIPIIKRNLSYKSELEFHHSAPERVVKSLRRLLNRKSEERDNA